jgi:hypothetical protein
VRRWRGRRRSAARADSDSDSKSNTHADANAHADTHSDADANADADTHSNTHADANADTHADADADTDTDTDPYADTEHVRHARVSRLELCRRGERDRGIQCRRYRSGDQDRNHRYRHQSGAVRVCREDRPDERRRDGRRPRRQ